MISSIAADVGKEGDRPRSWIIGYLALQTGANQEKTSANDLRGTGARHHWHCDMPGICIEMSSS